MRLLEVDRTPNEREGKERKEGKEGKRLHTSSREGMKREVKEVER